MIVHTAEEAGMSAGRLQRIDRAMQEAVQDNQMPGIMTLVQRRGKVVQHGLYGMMDLEAKKPMQADALFRIYSMTKPITSVALMMLLEEGRFNLDDPVARWIPAFEQTKVYSHHNALGPQYVAQQTPITIHHLLTHRAGLGYGFFADHVIEQMYRDATPEMFQREQTLQSSIERLAQIPLFYQPGSQWRYSFATDVVGYLVEVISGMPFADFLAERIFRPLGMVDTGFHVPTEKLDRLAQIYQSDGLYDPYIAGEDLPLGHLVHTPTLSPSGGGGLISTMADYLRFATCLINGGELEGERIIGRKTLEWMTVNHVSEGIFPLRIGEKPLAGHGFGLGFEVLLDRGQSAVMGSVGAYGWAGMAKTYFWIDPHEDLIGLLMTQYVPLAIYPTQLLFRNLVYQALVD